MAMRFRHLKKTSKEAVGVYRLVGLGGIREFPPWVEGQAPFGGFFWFLSPYP